MRSGRYKISGSGSKIISSNDSSHKEKFRSSEMEPPTADPFVPEFPHMNSLVVTMNKMSDSRALNKSCENLSGPRNAVNKVEQRVKSFLQRGESKIKANNDKLAPPSPEDVWQYGHVVTLPRRPRLSLALSSSTANQLLTSDTASCVSASSGYSSSSSNYGSFSSSYSSNCSSLPRRKTTHESHSSASPGSCTFVDNPMYDVTPATDPSFKIPEESLIHNKSPQTISHQSTNHSPADDPCHFNPKSYRRRSASVPRHNPALDISTDFDLHQYVKQSKRRESAPVHGPFYNVVTNSSDFQNSSNLEENDPIYDTIPGGDMYSPQRSHLQEPEHLYDVAKPRRLLTPDSGTHGGIDSLEESTLESLDHSDSLPTLSIENYTLKEDDQVAKECREYFEKRLKNSESLKKRWSMCSSDSGADSGDSETSLTCSTSSPATAGSRTSTRKTAGGSLAPSRKSSSDQCLSKGSQDKSSSNKTQLDHKMEYLRKEIASLMKQDNQLFKQLLTLHDSISALKSSPSDPHRAPSLGSLESFTEEEEEEERERKPQRIGNELRVKTNSRKGEEEEEENPSDVDEGLETDHSLTHSISPTSTLSSKSSRQSTMSSKSCRDSTLSSKSSRDSSFSTDCHYSPAEATSPESSPIQSTRPVPVPFQRASSSPSPHASNSSTDLDCNSANKAFMRSRKSYAPNARNRRRSSSAHLLVRPDLETITTENQADLLESSRASGVTAEFSECDKTCCISNGGEVSQLSLCSRQTNVTRRSLSLSNDAHENLLGKPSNQGTSENSNKGGSGGMKQAPSLSDNYKAQQQHGEESTRPRSSSVVLAAAMYPSIPSSRPFNHAVFREALIM